MHPFPRQLASIVAVVIAGCANLQSVPPHQIVESPKPAPTHKVQDEDSVRSTPGGVDLALHRRVMTPLPAGSNEKVVLLLHPFGIPGAAAFDVKGHSLMDYLASQGFDVWAIDYRGFGHSSAAPAMLNSRGEAVPTPRLEHVLADVKEAMDTVLSSTKAKDLSLIGYGYGGVVAGMAAEKYPSHVSRLVLYGTAFSFKIGNAGAKLRKQSVESKPGVIDAKLPPYREIDWESSTLREWQAMMDGRPLADKADIDAVAAAFHDTDYLVQTDGHRRVRLPTGPLVDLYRIWTDHPAFNAGKINVPTLIVRGDLDLLAEPNLTRKLSGTKIVREVVVKNATHWMLYEKSYEQVFAETSRFLGGN